VGYCSATPNDLPGGGFARFGVEISSEPIDKSSVPAATRGRSRLRKRKTKSCPFDVLEEIRRWERWTSQLDQDAGAGRSAISPLAAFQRIGCAW